MKKAYIIPLLAAAIVACTPVTPQEPIEYRPAETDGTMTVKVTLPANLLESSTKSLSVDSKGSLKPAWEKGDKILVNGKTFELSEIKGNTATFKGDAVSAKTYDIVYPASLGSVDAAISRTPGAQTQNGNGSVSHIQYYAALKGVKDCSDVELTPAWAAANGGTLHSNTVLKFVVTFLDAVTGVSSIKLDCGEKVYSMDLTNCTLGADHTLTAYMEVPGEAIVFANGQKVSFSAVDQDGAEVLKTFKPEAQTLNAGRVNEFRVGGDWPSSVKKGKGSMSDPYLITNLSEFDAIHNLLENDVITCFRLEADLDMKEITGWIPFNQENLPRGIYFDGNNHTISNFTSTESPKWASMFGVLHGTIKDLTLKDPVLYNTYAAPAGILCAWAGNSAGELDATIENVHIVNGKATSAEAKNYFGGMIGNAVKATIKNCSFDGLVQRTIAASNTYNPVGGLIGWTALGLTIENCSTSGTLKCAMGRSCGGVIGYVNGFSIDIKDCSSSMIIESEGDCVGGITGWTYAGNFVNCHSTGTIKAGRATTSATSSYVGGIAAHISTNASFENCSHIGDITAVTSTVGGIAGQCNAGTSSFKRCFVDANIKGTNNMGGIVSRTRDKDNVIIENCYTKGSITGSSSYIGGIVSDIYKDNIVRNCYTTMAIAGAFGIGGLIARASNASASSVLMGSQNFNINVSGCIAWNPSIKTTNAAGEDPAGHYSAGCVIGYTAAYNTLKDNYRKADMVFEYYAEGPGSTTVGSTYTYSGYNVAYDQDNTDASNALYRMFTDATKDKYYFPYFGKAAPADATISSLAKNLGWDETVWDLSGPEPKLR